MNRRFLLAVFLVALSVSMRLIPHPLNLTPAGAVALFSGACFDRKRWSFIVPFAALLASDLLGHTFHQLTFVVYAAFALNIVIGMLIRDRRQSPAAVAAGATASATIFYAVTNFAMWTISTIYPKTFAGLVTCYVAAIPFYGTMLAGDLIYSALLFGTFVWVERRSPAAA